MERREPGCSRRASSIEPGSYYIESGEWQKTLIWRRPDKLGKGRRLQPQKTCSHIVKAVHDLVAPQNLHPNSQRRLAIPRKAQDPDLMRQRCGDNKGYAPFRQVAGKPNDRLRGGVPLDIDSFGVDKAWMLTALVVHADLFAQPLQDRAEGG